MRNLFVCLTLSRPNRGTIDFSTELDRNVETVTGYTNHRVKLSSLYKFVFFVYWLSRQAQKLYVSTRVKTLYHHFCHIPNIFFSTIHSSNGSRHQIPQHAKELLHSATNEAPYREGSRRSMGLSSWCSEEDISAESNWIECCTPCVEVQGDIWCDCGIWVSLYLNLFFFLHVSRYMYKFFNIYTGRTIVVKG